MGGVGASQRPRVSVAMVTYNQEKFLAQAIESVLAQDFTDWELVIGEDCSTDGTLAVATRYEAAHPDRIRLLRDEVNLGGRGNYLRTLSACRGDFLAQLDGDDYWSDSTKLSRQVAWLDAHPECAIVFGATLNDTETPGVAPEVYYPPDRREFYDIEDLLRRNFIGSGAVLWREPDIEGLPNWFKTVAVGDWPMHVLCARGGRIGYIDDVMSVHREHALGVWGGLSLLGRTQQRLDVRKYFRDHFEGSYEDVFDDADLADHFHLAKTHRKAGQAIRACTESLWCLLHRNNGDRPTALRVIEEALHAVIPKLATELHSKPSPEWNHYSITCMDGSISLKVNGVLVTRGHEANPRRGYICLESEGGRVDYRNLRIREFPGDVLECEQAGIFDRGYSTIYTGVDLSGWEGDLDGWQVQDWRLVHKGSAGPSRLIQKTTRSDFGFLADIHLKDNNSRATIRLRGDDATKLDVALDSPLLSEHLHKGWNRLEALLVEDTLWITVNGSKIAEPVELAPGVSSGPGQPALLGPLTIEGVGEVALASLFVKARNGHRAGPSVE